MSDAPSPVMTEEFLLDPTPVIARLRAEDPVHFVPFGNFWLVTRYDDVRRLFTDPNVTNDRRAWESYVPPQGKFMRWVADNGLFALPPEEHARVRRLVTSTFTPRAVARMDGQVRDVVEQFAAPLRGRRGVVDLMSEYTDPIPNATISRVTGIPAKGGEEVRFRQLAQATIRGFFTFGDDAARKQGESAFMELGEWVRKLADERRHSPREDLISDLVSAVDEGRAMSDDEIVTLVTGLIGAGSETTAIGGMISILTLLDQPEAMARLRRDRDAIPAAVNEILRFGFGGGGGLPRYALHDFELRGKQIKKGQMILLSFAGAHRDPEVFPDPDRFDIDRDNSALTIFGHGPHYCIGVHLARSEMRQMIDAALDFLPADARWREDLVDWQRMGFFRRPNNLPVEF
jgi:cytochrome P450 enzyme